MQFCGIDGFGRFVKDGSGGSGGSAGLNFFTQLDEPSIKDGVWIKTASKYKNIVNDNRVLVDDGVWSNIKQLPISCYGGNAVFYDGEIHILGGSFSDSKQHYKYNGSTWTSVSTLPYICYFGKSVIYNNEIHILGGTYTSESYVFHYKYDGSTWTSVGVLPFEFRNGCAVVFNNCIHIYGGEQGKYHYKYDGSTWTSVSTLPVTAANGSSVVFNGEIHLLGGTDNLTGHYKYNGSTWTSVSTLPYKLNSGSAVVFNGEIHILGSSSSNCTMKHYKYNGSTWTSVGKLPFEHYLTACTVTNNSIFIIQNDTLKGYSEFSLAQAVFESNTIIIQRGDHNGVYLTNFVDVSQISGEHNRFVTGFDDVWYFGNGTFEADAEMYYGDGAKWIKFKN